MWTEEQEAIYKFIQEEKSNVSISACPGSGKTKVLEQIWNITQEKVNLYLAFNKSIVTEAKLKLKYNPYGVISTFHSLGFKTFRKRFDTKVDENKVYHIIKREFESSFPVKKREEYKYSLFSLVGYCKNNLTIQALKTPKYFKEDIQNIIEFFDLDVYEDIIEHCVVCLEKSNLNTKVIDFNDMLVLPLLYDCDFPLFEQVLVDESQDISLAQREMLRRLKDRNSNVRFIFVGDPHQSIYTFRGASFNSIELLQEEFSTETFKLTYSFRCPVEVVKEAQKVYKDDIKSTSRSIEGTVRWNKDYDITEAPYARDYFRILEQEDFHNSLVLCRTNAPLFNLAYQLLSVGLIPSIRGKSFGKGILKYFKDIEPGMYIFDFLAETRSKVAEKIEKYLAEDKRHLAERETDKLNTLVVVTSRSTCKYVEELQREIESMFSKESDIELSTIHRAKGLEKEKVFILAPELIPHKSAVQEWELEQEQNLKYVGITRSKKELIYL